jgi:hypothetical protein
MDVMHYQLVEGICLDHQHMIDDVFGDEFSLFQNQ